MFVNLTERYYLLPTAGTLFHTHTHTRTRTRARTRAHTRARVRVRAGVCARMHTRTHTQKQLPGRTENGYKNLRQEGPPMDQDLYLGFATY